MGALAALLSPYAQAVGGAPTTPTSLGMRAPVLLDLLGSPGMLPGAVMAPPSAPQGPAGASGGPYTEGNHWEQLAAKMAQNKYGWGPDQFADIDAIITQESNWNPDAVNPSSGAYGIPQILPQAHPGDLGLDPREQIRWMLDYIGGRYGSPSAAWDFKQAQGWY